MSIDPETLQKIRDNVCEETHKLINTVKKLHNFDQLSLGGQMDVLRHIQEGLFDAIDYHQPTQSTEPKSPE